ncbi:purine-binding chemotaxis protein CheW [Devosia sp. YR412]|uniref:chemotaxis protein CheW n=1 Tax=Devosia sp. YR412 TaxID=1881030 RepID=UPI0008BD3184|nr:chemotaxis protein CheW [Devosia sp. YR412]SEQ09433.1 purine-binding chemotaxis protein CheW [Devosia sp. YR412]
MASTALHDGRMTASAPVEAKTLDQFVTFNCGERAFGIDIMSVREIRSWTPTTELPGQPHGAKGVLDIRGSVVQVYDLAVVLGGYGRDTGSGQVVLVVSLDRIDVGLLVDSVSDIIFPQPEDLRPVPSGGDRGYSMVSGMFRSDDGLIAILNLRAIFPND